MAATQVGLKDGDPELYQLIVKEKQRQVECLELIASENFVTLPVLECLGSCLTNKYAEGYPGKRYYGGTQHIDEIETLCMDRALKAFNLDKETWHVNVQPLSGSPANLAALMAFAQPHDRIMGLSITDGGHLTHGAYNTSKKLSTSSIFFESMNYNLKPETGLLDYDEIKKLALRFRPKILICGYTAYPRAFDYSKFREIADSIQAVLLCDMAHVAGLVAGGAFESPFPYCDVVTSTSHKTLRGPRSGLIFVNKKRIPDGGKLVDSAVFPGLQGGPHENAIAALCHQLHMATTPEWKEYAAQVVKNAQAFSAALIKRGFTVATDGTDNHLLLVDLKSKNITGSKVQSLCDAVNITVNKNYLIGDTPGGAPSGIRAGTPAMTTRGLREGDFDKVADFFQEVVQIGVDIQAGLSSKKLVDFEAALVQHPSLVELRERIAAFCRSFPMPGHLEI